MSAPAVRPLPGAEPLGGPDLPEPWCPGCHCTTSCRPERGQEAACGCFGCRQPSCPCYTAWDTTPLPRTSAAAPAELDGSTRPAGVVVAFRPQPTAAATIPARAWLTRLLRIGGC